VDRDLAKQVRPWLGRAKAEGGFLVVVGDSSTGKTQQFLSVAAEDFSSHDR
jgi:hypothetical protein